MPNLRYSLEDHIGTSPLTGLENRPPSQTDSLEWQSFVPHFQAKSCAEITRTSGSSFTAAFRLLPKEKMEALTRIYAFCRIADDCVDTLTGAGDQQRALNFWRKELIKIYSKQPAHPVMEEVREVAERYRIPQGYFLGLIAGCEMDITKHRYETFEELYEYAYRVAGLVGLMCLRVFEYESPTAEDMAVNLGIALQLTNILRDIKADLEMGRIYLPTRDMKRFGYSAKELTAGRENQAFFRLMNHYAHKAQTYYAAAFSEFKNNRSKKLKAARLMARLYHKILKKIIKQRFPVLQKRVSLNFIEKSWLLFTTYLTR